MSSHSTSERKTEQLEPVTAEILLDELMEDFERKEQGWARILKAKNREIAGLRSMLESYHRLRNDEE